jgi:hypothetical protein
MTTVLARLAARVMDVDTFRCDRINGSVTAFA